MNGQPNVVVGMEAARPRDSLAMETVRTVFQLTLPCQHTDRLANQWYRNPPTPNKRNRTSNQFSGNSFINFSHGCLVTKSGTHNYKINWYIPLG